MEIDHTLRVYNGRCHCGAVRFTARTDLTGMMDCNCTHCRRRGSVLQPLAAADFELLAGADDLKSYRFNTEKIEHLFCRHCGIESFARGRDGKGNEMVMLNVNCLDDLPVIDRSTIGHWDGLGA
ncbi:hypothetical protein JP74_14275 [Devosia sp. 17-2-E-8]|nr:hypothetical protein JP74_14275 [Devosia sp. 17-2-E-8]CDP53447.1 Gfa-like protein [Devosia sp. DBB001]